MIILSEVATKIEKILNGTDNEVLTSNPTDFYYVVETQGFHLDHLLDKKKHKNFIPVFVSSMGGQFNPVQNLGEANYNIPVTFYFPVRFKNEMFALNEFLANALVGAYLNWGTLSGKAVSNISVSQFGEIQDLDMKQFSSWVDQVFELPVDVMEPYLSMTFNLYISSAKSGFVYGNDVTATLSYSGYIGDPEPVVFAESTIQSQTQSVSEQQLGTAESQGIPFGVAYGSGFSAYVKDDAFFKAVLQDWCDGNAQTMEFTLTITFNSLKVLDQNQQEVAIAFSRKCYLDSSTMLIRKGELLTMTFSFAKLIEEEEV